MIRFLIDENLSPLLTRTAAEFGYAAFHRAPGMGVAEGPAGAPAGAAGRRGVEVHPGFVVILPNVRRERQVELFTAALLAIQGHDPPLDMVNTVLEVDLHGNVTRYSLPDGH